MMRRSEGQRLCNSTHRSMRRTEWQEGGLMRAIDCVNVQHRGEGVGGGGVVGGLRLLLAALGVEKMMVSETRSVVTSSLSCSL